MATLHQPYHWINSIPSTSHGLGITPRLPKSESPLTLHNAVKLECLSRTRITAEVRDDPHLRRIVGHLAVYQKATEFILVTKMHQERARRIEDQFRYEQGDMWPEFSHPRKAPLPPSLRSPCLATTMTTELNYSVSVSQSVSQKKSPVEAYYAPSKPTPTKSVLVVSETTSAEFAVPFDGGCVYGVVNIDQQSGLMLSPVKIQVPRHMSSSATIHFWHVIMQSLSRLCNRKGRLHSNYDLRQLEAYGIYPLQMPST